MIITALHLESKNLHRFPVAPYRAGQWEFLAVLEGEVSLVQPAGPGFLRRSRLWVCSPGYQHGWTGADEPAQMVSFRFLSLPEPLRNLLPAEGFLEIPLCSVQRQRIRFLGRQAERYWRTPHPARLLSDEQILMELSLMIIEALPLPSAGPSEHPAQRRVDRAVGWFAANMENNPGFDMVAEAAGISAPQLRRDFHRCLGRAPREIFHDLQLKLAVQLIEQGELKLEAVAERCGFGGVRAFSRAFKARFGISPGRCRRGRGSELLAAV